MTLYTDNFTRSSASTLGADWSYLAQASGTTMEIADTAARSRTTTAVIVYLNAGLGPSTGDQFAAVTLTSNTGTSSAVGTRFAGTAAAPTGYIARHSGSDLAIIRLNGSTAPTTLVNTAHTRTANQRLVLVSQGATHTVYAGGSQILQTTDATYSTGRPGFRNSATTDVTYDDFQAGDYTADASGVNGLPSGPVTAPGQVTGLSVTATTASTASLAWTATANATSYLVEYKASSSSTWLSLSPTATSNSYVVTGLTASTPYDFRVTASNSAGSGTPSATASGTTAAAPSSPPGKVTGLIVGTPTSTTIPLSWTAVSTATSYTLEYRVTGNISWLSQTGITASSGVVVSLSPSTSYDLRVTAVNEVGSGTPSDVLTQSTAAAAGGIVETINPQQTSGRPAWRGIIQALDGEWIKPGLQTHRLHADFYGAVGAYTPPDWLSVPEGTTTLSNGMGATLRLTTAATAGASATLRLTVPVETIQVRAVHIELHNTSFSATNPNADWRLYVGSGVVGAQAVQLAGMDYTAICSQGDNNRTKTPQVQLGEDAHRRREVGFLVLPEKREAFLMEGESIIGWRDCSTTWTGGTAQIGVTITTQSATAAELRMSGMTVTMYA